MSFDLEPRELQKVFPRLFVTKHPVVVPFLAFLAGQFRQQHPDAGDPLDSQETAWEWTALAEEAKRSLSVLTRTSLRLRHAGKSIPVELTRAKFDELKFDELKFDMPLTKMLVIATDPRERAEDLARAWGEPFSP